MIEISNPHDKFFKEVFSRREVAVDFLRNYLPNDVLSCLDGLKSRIQCMNSMSSINRGGN